MLTQAEYHALCGELPNAARVLYFLGLRPTVNLASATSEALNYKHLLALINGDEPHPVYTRGRQVNELLQVLEQAGLIALPNELSFKQSLNGKAILLPLCQERQDQFSHLHRQHQAMHVRWQPDKALFDEMARLLGIIDTNYTEEDVGEFIAYWLGRPANVFSHFQWTQKFAYAMRYKRTALGVKNTRQVGSQQIPVAPGLEADDNARKLVEKYSSTNKRS